MRPQSDAELEIDPDRRLEGVVTNRYQSSMMSSNFVLRGVKTIK